VPALGRLQSSSLGRNRRHFQSVAAQSTSIPLRLLGKQSHTWTPVCSSPLNAAKPGPNKQARNGFGLHCFPSELPLFSLLKRTQRGDGEYHPHFQVGVDLQWSLRAVLVSHQEHTGGQGLKLHCLSPTNSQKSNCSSSSRVSHPNPIDYVQNFAAMFAKDWEPNLTLWALGIALASTVMMLLTAELGSSF